MPSLLCISLTDEPQLPTAGVARRAYMSACQCHNAQRQTWSASCLACSPESSFPGAIPAAECCYVQASSVADWVTGDWSIAAGAAEALALGFRNGAIPAVDLGATAGASTPVASVGGGAIS
jgi:hypothetical protein